MEIPMTTTGSGITAGWPSRQRPWREKWIVFGPAVISHVDDLHRACADKLAEVFLYLARSARQADGAQRVFESTFIIVSFQRAENVSAFVQFLSDSDHRTVLWEVPSLDYAPLLANQLTPARRAELIARGFRKAGSPSNFRRETLIADDSSARRVAEETLEILFDALGYRGSAALWLHVEAEQ
jgi:hypothetical protein